MDTHVSENEVVRDLAFSASEIREVPGAPKGVVAINGVVKDLGHLAEQPRRKKGRYVVHARESLVDYVQRQADEDTTLWVDRFTPSVTAVLNDHGEREPGWGDHRAVLAIQRTPEWQRWLALDGQLGEQETFAELIEDSLPEIAEPDGATLLEIAQSFQATSSAVFKAGNRLHDGRVQLRYEEEVEASAGPTGELSVPQEFKLAIAPFVGEEPVPVLARLRFRVRQGELRIGYKLDRPEVVELESLADLTEHLRVAFSDQQVYVGKEPVKGD